MYFMFVYVKLEQFKKRNGNIHLINLNNGLLKVHQMFNKIKYWNNLHIFRSRKLKNNRITCDVVKKTIQVLLSHQ